jgi:hypothetical protein
MSAIYGIIRNVGLEKEKIHFLLRGDSSPITFSLGGVSFSPRKRENRDSRKKKSTNFSPRPPRVWPTGPQM